MKFIGPLHNVDRSGVPIFEGVLINGVYILISLCLIKVGRITDELGNEEKTNLEETSR